MKATGLRAESQRKTSTVPIGTKQKIDLKFIEYPRIRISFHCLAVRCCRMYIYVCPVTVSSSLYLYTLYLHIHTSPHSQMSVTHPLKGSSLDWAAQTLAAPRSEPAPVGAAHARVLPALFLPRTYDHLPARQLVLLSETKNGVPGGKNPRVCTVI